MRAMCTVPEVGVAELPADAVMIDVREPDEWQAGHAPDAQHLPMSQLAERLAEVPDAEPLYVICRSGSRSARVVAFFNQQGRSSVNVAGGMQSWATQGRPMIAEHGGTPDVI
jgi:rhodanese-related sulfurtransferase